MSELGITAPAPAPDVIHDIGYRHYDGRRLGRAYALRSLYVQSLRGSFGLGRSVKSKILPMTLLGVMCIPALIAVAVAVYVKLNRLPIEYPHYLVIMEFVTAVFVASQAPVAVSRDLRFQTMPLYFSRPLTASDYVRAKFLAMATAVFVLTALPMLIFYLGAVFSKLGFVYNTEHFAFGLFAAVCYSLLYSAIALLIASATPRRGFGVAGIIAVLLISSAISGIIYGILNFREGFNPSHTSSAHWAGVISPAQLVDSLTTWLFNLRVQGMAGVPGAVGGIVFLAELVLIVAACYALLVRRYRRL